ncbi:MAG: universal stress protein [Sedimentibacter sp.]|uniref:universal stress protein n=1 Tax=Sedimentibacter sp. TaxID=1960295 RepID=UPI002982099E|nr:universal stress protein [Sedimentibacter sp.]MDW5299229.1 universal stress protein [Sedimentibacter sp.]
MKKILVPIDGSTASQNAAAKALEIARQFHSSVLFITVINEPDVSMYNKFGVLVDPEMKKLKEKLKENEKKMMDSIIDSLDTSDITISKKIASGIPYEEILREASEGNYDLIVMGQRGYSKIKRFFVGSVTYRVISDASCPVLTVHENQK